MKTMVKYFMNIDGVDYNALFVDSFEAADFLDENDRDGAITIVKGYKEVTVEDIMADSDFTCAEKIEYVAMLALPNHRDFKKYTEQEVELNKLGFYF